MSLLPWQHGDAIKPAYFSNKIVFIWKINLVTYLFYFMHISIKHDPLQLLRKFNKILYSAIFLKAKIL
jgi:hypothetical protein